VVADRPRRRRALLNAVFFLVLRLARHRQIAEPEVVAESSDDSDEGTWHPELQEESSDEEEEEEEEEVDDEVGCWSRPPVISFLLSSVLY